MRKLGRFRKHQHREGGNAFSFDRMDARNRIQGLAILSKKSTSELETQSQKMHSFVLFCFV